MSLKYLILYIVYEICYTNIIYIIPIFHVYYIIKLTKKIINKKITYNKIELSYVLKN